MAAMYDNDLRKDIITGATLQGAADSGSQVAQNRLAREAIDVAQEMAGNPTLTQLASQVPPQQEQPHFNQDLANQVLGSVLQQNMANTQPQEQQQPVQQPQEEGPAPTSGLLLSDNVLAALNNYDQQQAQPVQPATPQTLTQMARELAGQIVEAKNIYNQGAAIGGEQGMAAMMNAHTAAERARHGLLQLGVDPSVYGLDGDYNTARQAVADNDTRALKNVLEGDLAESSGEYYDRIYSMLRDQGFASDVAEREAHRRAESYASKRVRSLSDAFNTYGRNNTTINPLGVQILNMMADEDTEKAGSYLKQYARPLDEYAYAKQRGLAEQQHGYKKEDMATQHQYGLENMSYQAQLNAKLKAVQAELDKEARAQDFQYRVMLMDRQAQLQALRGGKGASGNGANAAQVKVWQEEVKRADDWDKDHIGQEKDNPYRASANAYKAMIDQSQGIGGGGGKDYDLDDYDQARAWVQDIINQNAAKPPKDQLDKQGLIVNLRKGLGYGEMADNIINNIEWGDEPKLYIQNPR